MVNSSFFKKLKFAPGNSIKNSIKVFQDKFPGEILYAVKTNPNEYVLKHIIKNGVDRFDVASINEVKLIRKLSPKSKLYFMHPIKCREDIASAYFDYNVKDYSLDTKEELMKILDSTKNANNIIASISSLKIFLISGRKIFIATSFIIPLSSILALCT